MTTEQDLLKRITAWPDVFGGKTIIRHPRHAHFDGESVPGIRRAAGSNGECGS